MSTVTWIHLVGAVVSATMIGLIVFVILDYFYVNREGRHE